MLSLRGIRRCFTIDLGKNSIPRPDCLLLPPKVTELPDPYIYSQFYLMQLGLPVTWNNPDIRILNGGLEVNPFTLSPDTSYEVQIRVHNSSPDKEAAQTGVETGWVNFGIGGLVAGYHLIGHHVLDIPPRGQPGEPRTFTLPWKTPVQPGHYCVQVKLTHPVDGNPGNNRGWNNTVVKDAPAGSPLNLEIPIWNAFPGKGYRGAELKEAASQVQLTLDSYLLDLPEAPAEGGADTLFEPVPARWNASITPTSLAMQPDTGPKSVSLEVEVPPDAKPGLQAHFNVAGWVGGRPVGGVTLIARIT